MNRPYVLSIAGLDPSGGAGILADVKTFESAKVQGFGVATSLTYQNESAFIGLHWVNLERIIAQIDPLIDLYPISVIKIGLIENPQVLKGVIAHVRQRISDVTIIWDPILKASAGFDFHKNGLDSFFDLLKDIDVITPNWKELQRGNTSPLDIAIQLSHYCAVVLKGGHSDEERANDYLVVNGQLQSFSFPRLENVSKHGTGCMFSSSIAAHLALKDSLHESVLAAKTFVFERLQSQEGGLASF
jgi:hydroxymethylpyrimidine/phosphomethylpyrimidine kinase